MVLATPLTQSLLIPKITPSRQRQPQFIHTHIGEAHLDLNETVEIETVDI